MSQPTTALSDTFNTWRQNTNTVSVNVGDPTSLTTTIKTSLVSAVNELDTDIGAPSSLTTTAKSSLVAAVNELDGDVGNLGSLVTSATGSLVLALNEVSNRTGVLSSLSTTAQNTLVAAINEVYALASSPTGVTLGNITGGPLAVAKGGTGRTSLGNISAGSAKLSVSGGTATIIGAGVSLDVVPSQIAITSLQGTLTVEKGGTGRTTLDDIVAGSSKVTISNGASTIVGGDVTIDIDPSQITSLGTLTSLIVSGAVSFGANLAVTGNLTLTGTGTFNNVVPLNMPNVTIAGITSNTHATTKAYVDNLAPPANNDEVEFDSDFMPGPVVPASGTNRSFQFAHGMASEPNFVMGFSRSYASEDDTGGKITLPCMCATGASGSNDNNSTPAYIRYDATNIYTKWVGNVANLTTIGAGSTIVMQAGELKLTAINKTPGYNSGWFAVALNTAYTKAHGLAAFPHFTVVELAENSDGTGWRVPAMGGFQYGNGGWRETTLASLNATNAVIRTGPSGSLTNFYDEDGTLVQPTTAYCRVQCYNWTPDYDSGWITITTAATLRDHFLKHGLKKEPSIAMLYLAQDTDGSSPIAGTSNTPGGWVIISMNQYLQGGNVGTVIYDIGKQYAVVHAGSSRVTRFHNSVGTDTQVTTAVFRLMLWK